MTAVQPEPSDRTSRRGRRLRRFLLWSAASLVLLVAAVALLLESAWIRELARSKVEQAAEQALGREVSIGSLDFDLFALAASAEEIAVAGPAGLVEPLATAQRLEVEIGPGVIAGIRGKGPLVLRRVEIVEPLVELWFDGDGASNLPELPEREGGGGGIEVRLELLTLVDGRARLEQREVPLHLVAEAVEAGLAEQGSAHRLRAYAKLVTLDLPEMEPFAAAVRVDGTVADGALALDRVELDSATVDLEASGTIDAERIEIEADGRVDTSLLVHLGLVEEMVGDIAVEARFDRVGEEWNLRGAFESGAITAGEVEVVNLAGRFEGDTEAFHVDVGEAGLLGADIAGTVDVPLGEDMASVTLRGRLAGLDLGSLVEEMTAAETGEPTLVGLGAILGADFEYRFDPSDPLGGNGSGRADVAPPDDDSQLPIAGSGAFAITAGQLSLEEIELRSTDLTVELAARYDLENEAGDVDFDLETTDLLGVAQLAPVAAELDEEQPWSELSGGGRIVGTAAFDPQGFTSSAEVELRQLTLDGTRPANGAGELTIDSGGVQSMRLTLQRGDARADLSGAVPFPETPAGYTAPDLSLALAVDDWPLADIEPWLEEESPVAGTMSADLAVRGRLEAPSGTGRFELDELSIAGVDLPGVLTGGIAFDPESIEVGPIRLAAPGGDIELAGTLQRPTGEIDLRLLSSPLDLAAQPLSDWIAAELSGERHARRPAPRDRRRAALGRTSDRRRCRPGRPISR